MSVNGGKILVETKLILVDDVPTYRSDFRLTDPIPQGGGHYDTGTVDTPIGALTESTFNLTMQQAVADKANSETSSVEQFVAGDVYGGRI